MFVDAQDEDGDNPGGIETIDRAGEAAVAHTGIQQRTTNGITDGGGADQQPFDPADDMVIDGESIHVGHDPMDKSAPDANRGAGEAASMEQETNAQTMKDMAERDKLMQDTAAAIRQEAMETIALRQMTLQNEFEESKRQLRATLVAEAAEEM